MQLFWLFPTWKEEGQPRGAKSYSHASLFIWYYYHQGSTFYPMLAKTLPHTKGSKTNSYNLPDSLNQLDWTSPFKMPRRNFFSWRIDCLSKITATPSFEKGQEIRDYCDVKWLSDHHFIYTIEKSWKITILVNIGDQDRPINIRAIVSCYLLILMPTSKRLFLKERNFLFPPIVGSLSRETKSIK